MSTETDVRDILSQTKHPSFGLSLSALGMVRAVVVSDGRIEVQLVMNCQGCPGPEAVLASLQRRLEGLRHGTVRLVTLSEEWRPPWE